MFWICSLPTREAEMKHNLFARKERYYNLALEKFLNVQYLMSK